MKPLIANPVKYFVGALYSSESLLEKSVRLLTERFSPTDLVSESFPFDNTNYYDAEMGTPIFRKFFSFSDLISPSFLAEAKLITNDIEDCLTVEDKRKVNLDIGYMDYDKVVLGSVKYGIHKIYLDKGIYADMALHYEKGSYSPYPWAFMDFKFPDYYPFFLKMRIKYKSQVKEMLSPGFSN